MFGCAKTESGKDAGSAGTGTEVPVRPRTRVGDPDGGGVVGTGRDGLQPAGRIVLPFATA
jgi:hypothetical protein